MFKVPTIAILSIFIAICSCGYGDMSAGASPSSERKAGSSLVQAAEKVLTLAPSDWTGKIVDTNANMKNYFWEGSGTGVCLHLEAKDKTYTETILGQESKRKAFLTMWIMPSSFRGKPNKVQPESVAPPQFLGKNKEYEVYFLSGGLWSDALSEIRRLLDILQE